MNAADLVIIGTVGLLALMGLKSGLLKPAFGIGGLVLGIVFAIHYSEEFAPLLTEYVEGDRLRSIAAFIGVLISVAVATRILAALIKKLLSALVLGWVDHVAGALGGAVLGIVLVGTVVSLLGRADLGPTHNALAASKLGPEISRASLISTISTFLPDCNSLEDAISGAQGCPDVKGFVGEFVGADLAGSVDDLLDENAGNLAQIVKGALSGESAEEVASLVSFSSEPANSEESVSAKAPTE